MKLSLRAFHALKQGHTEYAQALLREEAGLGKEVPAPMKTLFPRNSFSPGIAIPQA